MAQALAQLDRCAPLTVAMIVVAGGLAKAGHGEWGVCLIAGYCILFSAAAQLWVRARIRT